MGGSGLASYKTISYSVAWSSLPSSSFTQHSVAFDPSSSWLREMVRKKRVLKIFTPVAEILSDNGLTFSKFGLSKLKTSSREVKIVKLAPKATQLSLWNKTDLCLLFQINNMKTKFKETIEKCDSLEHRLNDLLKEKQSLERK